MDNEETATLNAIKEVKKDIVDLENKLAYWRSMVSTTYSAVRKLSKKQALNPFQ
jgi:hypothetical protein